MIHNSISLQSYLDAFKVNHSGIQNTLKTMGQAHQACLLQNIPKDIPVLDVPLAVAENALKHTANSGRHTAGISAEQFLLTLADQNIINAALLTLNVALAKEVLASVDKLTQVTALRSFQNGR